MSLNPKPIITSVSITPNPVATGAEYVISVQVESPDHNRLTAYTHNHLSVYTHQQLGEEQIV